MIVSNDSSNRHLNRVQEVPLTSNTTRFFPSEASASLNGQIRNAMADQIATVSKLRLSSQLGTLALSDMEQIDLAIRVQLGL